MPLDGHDFLVSQGWSGKGTGLRQGAISRPIAIPQKRNLAGLGKDRDEAFPFWDHLFTAASKSIQLKLASDDESDEETSLSPEIKRTATGIISNRRPMAGASAATSGINVQDVSDRNPRFNLLTLAKRDAARTSLYARFLRGPILGPDDVFPALPAKSLTDGGQTNHVKTNDQRTNGDNEDVETLTSKRKRNPEDAIARAQRKRMRKEQKAIEKEERRALRRERRSNDKLACRTTSDDTTEKEKRKRRKLESREKEKSQGDCADQVLEVKGKKKEKSRKEESRKADLGAADIPRTLKNGACAPTDESVGMLDPDAAEQICTNHQPSNAADKRKKKRKREEA